MKAVCRCLTVLVVAACVACAPGVPVGAADPVAARCVVPFSGTLDLKGSKVVLTFGDEQPGGGGVVIFEAARPVAGRYELKADIRHVATPLGDAAAVLSGYWELVGADPLRRELLGEVATQYTLLNYKPVRDVHVRFAVRERSLVVDPLWFGALSGRGRISLVDDHPMDVALDLLSADLEEFFALLHGHGLMKLPLSGTVTGSLVLQGPLARPLVSGRLAAYEGRWKDFGYETIDLRFKGTYPMLRLEDGRLISSDGPSFRLEGAIDLGDLARLGTQVRHLKRELIVADDVGAGSRAFRLNVSDGHATRLKSFVTGDADGRNQGEQVIGIEKQIGF